MSVGWRPAYLLSARLLKIELLVSCSPTINRGTKCRRGWRDTIDRVKKKKRKQEKGDDSSRGNDSIDTMALMKIIYISVESDYLIVILFSPLFEIQMFHILLRPKALEFFLLSRAIVERKFNTRILPL